MLKMKCCLNKHSYFVDLIKDSNFLQDVFSSSTYINENYFNILRENIDIIYDEFMRQYECVPILRRGRFLVDIILLTRQLEFKVKANIFTDKAVNWDNPKIEDFVLQRLSTSNTISNNTPFSNNSQNLNDINNRDFQENVDMNSYNISKQQLQQRLKSINWKDIWEKYVNEMQKLFWRITPFCDYEEEIESV